MEKAKKGKEVSLDNKGKITAEFLKDIDEETLEVKATNISKLDKIIADPDKVGETYYIKKIRGSKKVMSSIFLRIPLIGGLIINKKIQEGYVIAEVIFSNQQVKRFLAPINEDFVEIRQGDAIRFFNIDPLRTHPEKYIKFEDGKPIVQFSWNFPNPIPIKPTVSTHFDLDTYGVLLIRQRSKAGAKPIQQFLEQAQKDLKLIKILAFVAAGAGFAQLLEMFGFFS